MYWLFILFMRVCMLTRFSRVHLCVTPWTVARQAPLSMGFSRQEYWSRLPCLPPGHLQDSWNEPVPPGSSALAGGFFTTRATWEASLRTGRAYWGFPCSSPGKESACSAGDSGSIPGSGSFPGEGIGYPLPYSWVSLVVQMVKNHLQCRRPGFSSWVEKIPWRRT